MFPVALPPAADFTLCSASTSNHDIYVHTTNMSDPARLLNLSPGDCYFTNSGEQVTIYALTDYKLNHGKVRHAGVHTIKDSPSTREITIRVR